MLFLVLLACQTDQCTKLCQETTAMVNSCMKEWGADWEHLDVSSMVEFQTSCENQWEIESSNLEWREQEEAKEQCELTSIALSEMESSCSMLESLYFYDP